MASVTTDSQASGVTQVDVGVLVVRDGLLVTHWNEVLAGWTGIPAADVVGTPLASAAALPTPWVAVLQDVLGGGPPAALLGDSPFAPTEDDGARDVVATACPIPVEGRFLAFVSLVDRASLARAESTDVPEIHQRLSELGMMDEPEFLKESLIEFIDTTTDLVHQLGESIDAADRDAIVAHAHRLAGSAVTLGADKLSRLAAEIENHPDESADSLGRRFQHLTAESDRVRDYCRSLLV